MGKRVVLAAVVAIAAAIAIVWMLGRGGRGSGGHASASSGSASSAPAHDGSRAPSRRDQHGGDPATLAGTVKTKAGAPIAGAWVCANASDADLGQDQLDPHCATTGDDGAWKLDGLFAGHWSASAGADGKIPADWRGPDDSGSIHLHPGEDRTGIDLVLADGGVLVSGTVLDLTGGPVEGAYVSVGGGFRSGSASCFTRSGAGGAFHCWVAPGGTFASAFADGYTDGFTMVDAPEDGVELLLTPESTLDGVVVLAGTQDPVAGARVQVGGEWGDGATAISDAQGHFHLAHLAPGRYKPVATAPALHGEAAESVLVGIADGKDAITIEMHPAASVHGTVTLAGKPVDDCSVTLSGKSTERYDESVDDDGAVTFDAVQPGSYHVGMRCAKETGKLPYPDVVVADQPVEAAWEVDAGGTLTGVVIDDSGAPVPRAFVRARGDKDPMWGGASDATDVDGHFSLAGLTPGSAHLEVDSDDHPSPEPPITVEIGKDHDVRVVLPAGGVVTGTVITASGAPVGDVDLAAESGGRSSWGPGGSKSHKDGSFTLRGLRPGDYRIVAMRDWRALRRPGTTDDDTQGEPVTVIAGKRASVRIVVEDPSGAIRGTVVDASGAPVTDAFLRAERESDAAGAQEGAALESARWGWDKKPSVTSTDGSFTIDGLSPGKYTVLAYRKGGSEAKQEGVAIGATVTLRIARAGSLAGTVTSANGPPRSVTLSVADKKTGFERSESFFLSGGRWAIRDLPAGTYEISAITSVGKAKVEGIALGEGEDRTDVAITLAATVQVTGRLVDAETHAPIPHVQVFIMPIGGSFTITPGDMEDTGHVSGDDGRFTCSNVATGKTGLVAFPAFDNQDGKYQGTMRHIDVEGSDTVDVGDIPMRASRLPPHTEPGDLGFKMVDYPPGADPTTVSLQVASVRKDGPAAAAGLQVGDVIVSVDGIDVRGDNAADYEVLASVPPGTVVTLGLARGATVKIKAGKPA